MPDHEKRITELEERVEHLLKSRPLRCYDCGRCYEKGPDLVIDPDAWAEIAPHDGEGVLCPNCIHDRLVAGGFMDGTVHAVFTSGPMAGSGEGRLALLEAAARMVEGSIGSGLAPDLTVIAELLAARGIALAEPTAAGDRAWAEAIREQAREIGGAWGGAW